jgi:SSS family solute:Na+ symporter
MGLLWKKATNSAALWTAIFTIPVGIALKVALPELPFLLRMGYVCMILIAIAVTISLLDKKHLVAAKELGKRAQSLKKSGWGLAVLSLIFFVAGLLCSAPLAHLGFQAIFVLAALFAFLAAIVLTNAYSKTQDDKAYSSDPALFKTDATFFIGAMGICIIIIALYAYFW